MLTVMDMETGNILEAGFGVFEDEVLNAEWQAPRPELQLGLQPCHPDAAVPRPADIDPEAYLRQVYRCQA